MVNYPGSLDSLSNPGPTTKRNDPGFELDVAVSNLNDIDEALEAKLGIGATTPDAIHKSLKATAAGTSAWGYYQPTLIAPLATPNGATISFTSINQNFENLLIVLYARGSQAAASSNLLVRFNGSSSAEYEWQRMFANTTSVAASEGTGATAIEAAIIPAASATANKFGEAAIWIPAYARSANDKSARSNFMAVTSESSGAISTGQYAGCWRPSSIAAITQVDLLPSSGNFANGTVAALYGLPGV